MFESSDVIDEEPKRQRRKKRPRRVSRVLQRFHSAVRRNCPPSPRTSLRWSPRHSRRQASSVVHTTTTTSSIEFTPKGKRRNSLRHNWDRLRKSPPSSGSILVPRSEEDPPIQQTSSQPIGGRFRRRRSSLNSNVTAVIPDGEQKQMEKRNLMEQVLEVDHTHIPEEVVVEEDDDNVSRMTSEFYWRLQFDEHDPVRQRSLLTSHPEHDEDQLLTANANSNNQQIHIINNINNKTNNINSIMIIWMLVLSAIVLADTKNIWAESIVPLMRQTMMKFWSFMHPEI